MPVETRVASSVKQEVQPGRYPTSLENVTVRLITTDHEYPSEQRGFRLAVVAMAYSSWPARQGGGTPLAP